MEEFRTGLIINVLHCSRDRRRVKTMAMGEIASMGSL